MVKIVGQQGATRFLIDAGEIDGLPAARIYDIATNELGDPVAVGSITAHSPGWEKPFASDAFLETVRESVEALSVS